MSNTRELSQLASVISVADETRNVGIGTTNPISKLHVVGDVRVSGVVTATSFSGDGSALTGISGGSSSSQFVTTAAGIHTLSNVGIGTTNPTSRLHVSGDVRVSGVVTATTFVGALIGTATSTTNIPNLTGAITSNNTTTSLGSFTSLQLATALTDETGSGANVFATSPVLVTPALGTPSSGTLTSCTGLPITGITSSTTIGLGVGSIELGHASDTSITRVSAGVVAIEGVNIVTTSSTDTLTNKTLTSPTLSTPALGTPSSGTLTSCTGLPVSTGISGLAANVATFLATPSSANLAAALTDETGSGANVFATSPTLVTPVLGAATATSIVVGSGVTINASGIVASAGIITATTFVGALTGTATSTTNIPNLSGDITSANTVTTLATVNSNVGTFGSGGSIPSITVNAKGLVTGVTTTAVNPANDGALTLAVSGTGLSGSASFTANQSGASSFTVTSNATNANTASAIVARDASGNFSAGTITASLTGTASNVTTNANLTGHVTSVGNAAVLGSFTSLQLLTALTDETGTGANVFATSPTLVTPVLGTPSSGTLTNCTFPTLNQNTSGNAATVTTNANLTGHVTSVGNAAVLGSFTSLQLLTALTDETGSGANVFATSPTLVTPLLGTPTSGNLTNCTFPTLNQNTTGNAATVTTNANLTGHVTSVGNAAVLGSFTSLQLLTALTDETGSGANVFATSPTLVTPLLGTPSSGTLSNCTVDGTFSVGFKQIPPVGTKTSSYTLVAGDVGKFVELGTSGTVVVPASVFSAGDAIMIFNNTAASITCTCSAVTTVYKGGTDADISTFSVTTRGVVTFLFISATVAVVTGNLA